MRLKVGDVGTAVKLVLPNIGEGVRLLNEGDKGTFLPGSGDFETVRTVCSPVGDLHTVLTDSTVGDVTVEELGNFSTVFCDAEHSLTGGDCDLARKLGF